MCVKKMDEGKASTLMPLVACEEAQCVQNLGVWSAVIVLLLLLRMSSESWLIITYSKLFKAHTHTGKEQCGEKIMANGIQVTILVEIFQFVLY